MREFDPTDDELRKNFDEILDSVRKGGGLHTSTGLDMETEGALWVVARAHPNPTDEQIDAAKAAFAGQLDGTNARHRSERLATEVGEQTGSRNASDRSSTSEDGRLPQFLSGREMVGLARKLWAIDTPQPMSAAGEVAADIGCLVDGADDRVALLTSPHSIVDGTVRARGGMIIDITVDLSTVVSSEERDQINDLFVEAAGALSEEFGAPTLRAPGAYPAIRWRSQPNTLVLQNRGRMVQLSLLDTRWLDRLDAADALAEEGE